MVIITALALTAWQSKPADSPTQQATADFFQRWLNEDVLYIITPAEREAFNRLQSNEEREKVNRSVLAAPRPHTRYGRKRIQGRALPAHAFCQPFRIAVGHAGLEDRSWPHIYHVRPTRRNRLASGWFGRQPPYEDWRYRFIEASGSDVSMEFVDTELNGEFHMSRDPNETTGVYKNPGR